MKMNWKLNQGKFVQKFLCCAFWGWRADIAESFLSNNTFLTRFFGGNLRLWSRFAPPQNDLWWPNFSQMESKHLSSENNFPFPDSAARKDSRTNSAKIALSQWKHYLAAVFILNFHFLRGLEQIWCQIRNKHTLAVPNMASDLILVLSSACGGVVKGEKRVKLGVIFGNRLSSAVEWTDCDGINCTGKRNVPATPYWNLKRIGALCPVRFPRRFGTILANFATFSFLAKSAFPLRTK